MGAKFSILKGGLILQFCGVFCGESCDQFCDQTMPMHAHLCPTRQVWQAVTVLISFAFVFGSKGFESPPLRFPLKIEN
jgi:hypothetical protein